QNLSPIRPPQPRERLQQNRFPRARTAGNPEDLSAPHLQVQLVVHGLLSEPVDDVVRGKDGLGVPLPSGTHRLSFSKRIENRASSTITSKIALTTACVVSRPTLS